MRKFFVIVSALVVVYVSFSAVFADRYKSGEDLSQILYRTAQACDPSLICGQALTCVDGQLYPTTCGPTNCDEPIGLCCDEPIGLCEENSLLRGIRNGRYAKVPLDSLVPLAVVSGQITQEEINRFVSNAHAFFSTEQNRRSYEQGYDQESYDRWEITVEGGGAVQIFRTNNVQEFLAGWDGVSRVLEALRDGQDFPGIQILVRGTERFFDIDGIGGVGGRTWIAFDLR